MNPSRTPAESLDPIQAWVRQINELAAESNMSQRQLAKTLRWSPATINRYVKGERIPDQSTVTNLVALINEHGGSVDATAVLDTLAAAEEAFKNERRLHPNGEPLPPAPTERHTDDSDHQETTPRENEVGPVRRRRRRRTKILVAVGVAASATAVAVVAMNAPSGASQSDEPRAPAVESSASCVAEACTGKNHNEQGCRHDARPLPGGRDDRTTIIDVMYSPVCQAAWAKTKGAPHGAVIKVADTNGLEQRARAKSVAVEATPKPTPMIPAPAGARIKACIVTVTEELCTDVVEILAG